MFWRSPNGDGRPRCSDRQPSRCLGQSAGQRGRLLILGYLTLASLVLTGALLAVRAKSLIRAALALCLGGSSLAALFFMLGAPYAGSVQLSVGAGLLSILFIIAISLTESMRGGLREQ